MVLFVIKKMHNITNIQIKNDINIFICAKYIPLTAPFLSHFSIFKIFQFFSSLSCRVFLRLIKSSKKKSSAKYISNS